MGDIVAVAFLVGCASNLLICENLPALPDRFSDMGACKAALPALMRHHESRESGPPVVMGKCRPMIRPEPSMVPPETVFAGSAAPQPLPVLPSRGR